MNFSSSRDSRSALAQLVDDFVAGTIALVRLGQLDDDLASIGSLDDPIDIQEDQPHVGRDGFKFRGGKGLHKDFLDPGDDIASILDLGSDRGLYVDEELSGFEFVEEGKGDSRQREGHHDGRDPQAGHQTHVLPP